ncbi:MAG: oxidoreductase [Methanophagales archaeon]|nr:oxidoreductase [Methanophagales archaeon]
MGEEKEEKEKKEKIKLAFYWGATCGGCDVATLDIKEKILDVVSIADIVLWPVAMDFKYTDVEEMEPDSIDVCLFNGAIQSSEHEEIAEMLREKSKVMIAYGSCACFGGIPGLGNVANREQIFKTVFKDTPSTVNPEFVTPQTEMIDDAGEKLTLPEIWDTVKTLDQTVDVDYYVPGCPPVVDRINDAIGIIAKYAETGELPPKAAVVAFKKALCDECERKKDDAMKIKRIYRPYELTEIDPEKCLLEQGLLCTGSATRGGCGARCIKANMPCRGCYGPTSEIKDQGAAALSAVASILGIEEETEMIEEGIAEEVDELLDQVKDPLGTFYRFGLPNSRLKRVIINPDGGKED